MGRYRLEGRESDFFDFESRLIELQHAGFPYKIKKGIYILATNPLLRNGYSQYKYKLPKELEAKLDPNRAVEFIVGSRTESFDGLYGTTNVVKSNDVFYRVEDIEDSGIPIPSSRLTVNEFLYNVSNNWDYAESSQLDLSIAMQVVSAPIIKRVGGVGSQTFCLNSALSQQHMSAELRNSIFNAMPYEFMRMNSLSQYHLVESGYHRDALRRRLIEETPYELPYNIMAPINVFTLQTTKLPPSMPTLIRDSFPVRGDPSLQRDLVEFSLKAHMRNPTLDDQMKHWIKEETDTINQNLSEDLLDIGMIVSEDDVSRMVLSIERIAGTSRTAGESDRVRMRRALDALIKYTCEVKEDIIEKRRDINGYVPNKILNFRQCTKAVYRHISIKTRDIGSSITHEDILIGLERRCSYKEIDKSIQVLIEEGFIISLGEKGPYRAV